MKIKNVWLLLTVMLLYPLMGCSDDSGVEMTNPSTVSGGMGNELVIYEANPKVFGTQNALNAISARLDEIKALGTNVLWLMPVYEQGVVQSVGSPYCVKDYKKLNANYGTMDELKSLVKKAHEKGMRVIFDWIANHTSWDNGWIQNKSWYMQDAAGNIISPEGKGWADVADLNYNNADMRKAMLEAMKYWITAADADGFRCDYAEGVPDDFWAQAISELRSLKGDNLLMLAEGSKASLYKVGFDMVYGWNFTLKLQEVFAGKATLSSLYDVYKQEYQGVPEGKQRLRYSTNHDLASEQSPVQAYKSERGAMAAFVIASTLGGTPLIYSSQEIGYADKLSFFEYHPMDWNANPTYQSEYKQLMHIYLSSSTLRNGELRMYNTGKAASFYRMSGDKGVLVFVSTSDKTEKLKLPIERVGDRVRNLITNEVLTLPGSLDVEPYQYFIWEKE